MSAGEEYKYDFFLSYTTPDQKWVNGFLIGELGLPPERIICQKDFALGELWVNEFEQAVKSSRYTILVLTPAYLNDELARLGEHLVAFASIVGSQRLIPLYLKACELPLHIQFRVSLDCTHEEDWKQQVDKLRQLVNQTAPPDEQIACPYPGMRPFTEADKYFYGRTEVVKELVRGLRKHRFHAVIGPSGSGKSSLVFAGLVPTLREKGLIGNGKWIVYSMRPGEEPMATLCEVLGLQLSNSDEAIAQVLKSHTRDASILLIVDQFEELFTITKSTSEQFQKMLLQLSQIPTCYVILTVRADFYPHLMRTLLWSEIQKYRTEIAPLDHASLCEVIEQPAAHVGVSIEDTLVDRLALEAADEPGILPFIQETMVLLWDSLVRHFLPLSAYEDLTQSSDEVGLSGLQVAMSLHANHTYSELAPEQQIIARRLFIRLINLNSDFDDQRITRRPQKLSSLLSYPEKQIVFEQTLNHLAENRLLTLSGKENSLERKVDIVHDTLIDGWETLRTWITENRAAETIRRQLEDKAVEWKGRGKGETGLLDIVELQEAERWLKTLDAPILGYTDTLHELVQTSRARLNRQERRKKFMIQSLVAFSAVFFIVAIAAVVLYIYARGQSNIAIAESNSRATQQALAEYNAQQARNSAATSESNAATATVAQGQAINNAARSESMRLSAEANSILQNNGNPELATLLGIRALETTYSTQADTILLKVLDQPHSYHLFASSKGSAGVVAFSPDGKFMISASGTFGTVNEALLWDVQTGTVLRYFVGHTNVIKTAVFSPDGKYILTASWDNTARLWDAENGTELRVFSGHTNWVNSAVFSPDGQYVLTGSLDKTARLWETETGREIREFIGHTEHVYGAVFSPDGRQVATYGADNTARLWDVVTGEQVRVFTGHTGSLVAAQFSPDGQYILTGSLDKTARLWEVATGEEVQKFSGHTDTVIGVAFSPSAQYVVTGSWDHTARLWSISTGTELRVFVGHESKILSVAYSPDGQYILTGSEDGSARLWNALPNKIERVLSDHLGGVLSAAFSPDGKYALTGGADGVIRQWDLETETIEEHIQTNNEVVSIAYSPDAKTVLVGSWNNIVQLWDIKAGQELHTFSNHTNWITSVVFSPDGKYALTGSRDNTARLWDVETGAELRVFSGHTNWVNSVAFSPDGKYALTGSGDTTTRLWNIETGENVKTFSGHTMSVLSVAFSPDEKFILTGGADNVARLWDIETGKELKTFRGQSDWIVSVAFSPDGKYVLTGSWDGTAQLWEVYTGERVRVLSGHKFGVYAAIFSPDGKYILTGSLDGTARIWNTDYRDWLSFACTRVFRDFTNEERTQFNISDEAPTCHNFAETQGVLSSNSWPLYPTPVIPVWTSLPLTPLPTSTSLPSYEESNDLTPVSTMEVPVNENTIAFTSNSDGNWQIFLMEIDGSKLRRLTANSSGDNGLYGISWSPDRTQIAFESNRDGNEEIYVLDINTNNSKRLTKNDAIDRAPSWAPDGTRIAFESYRDGNAKIYMIDFDGDTPYPLTEGSDNYYAPNWSPDGSQIAFFSDKTGNNEIYVMDADGKNIVQLTNNGSYINIGPHWSPDGTQLVFFSKPKEGENWQICIVDVFRKTVRWITDTNTNNTSPAWSPDGHKILFISNRDGDSKLYIADSEGENAIHITNGISIGSPSW